MDITMTMPKTEPREFVEKLFNEEWDGEDVPFPFGRTVRDLHQGEYLYLIYRGLIRGRLTVTRVEQTPQTIRVGSEGHPVRARTVVYVHCRGVRADRVIHRESHRGHRYDNVLEWGG